MESFLLPGRLGLLPKQFDFGIVLFCIMNCIALKLVWLKERQAMMGRSQKTECKLFYHGVSLDRRVPADHPLRRIGKLIDFTFVRSRVEELYGVNGNVSVDPAVILKLMFLLIYEDLKSERGLMEQLPLRLDWLWFCGYDLDDDTPDHSVISKALRRWGQEVFEELFDKVLCQYEDSRQP
jgi:transposase